MASKEGMLAKVNRHYVEMTGLVVDDQQMPLDAAHLEEHLDEVMSELLKLDVHDPAVSAAASKGLVEISVQVDAGTVEDAFVVGSSAIRTAIHAAGGSTPHWELQVQGVASRRAGLVDA